MWSLLRALSRALGMRSVATPPRQPGLVMTPQDCVATPNKPTLSRWRNSITTDLSFALKHRSRDIKGHVTTPKAPAAQCPVATLKTPVATQGELTLSRQRILCRDRGLKEVCRNRPPVERPRERTGPWSCEQVCLPCAPHPSCRDTVDTTAVSRHKTRNGQ